MAATTSSKVFLDDRSLNVVRSKLMVYPPRGPFAQFPLQTQVDLVPFELTLELRLEGLWAADASLEFPSITCLLEDILLFSPHCFAVNRRALDAYAWELVEKANREYLLTDDEIMHLQQHKQKDKDKDHHDHDHNDRRLKYALRFFPEMGHQWLDMMGSVDMMRYPSELSRWIQTSVANAFATAARRNELITQHKRFTLQLELCAPAERPFHLHLYLSSQDNEADWDLKAWHHYVVLINARARRQAAKNAFYGILQLIRAHQTNGPLPLFLPVMSSSSSSSHTSSSCRTAAKTDVPGCPSACLLTTHDYRKAAPSSKIDALRAKQDAAVLEVLLHFSQCTARMAC
jgi:hypothetical protein